MFCVTLCGPRTKNLEALGYIIPHNHINLCRKAEKMQILTFLLVSVGLVEIHDFKWVIGCFSLVFSGLSRSRSIVR